MATDRRRTAEFIQRLDARAANRAVPPLPPIELSADERRVGRRGTPADAVARLEHAGADAATVDALLHALPADEFATYDDAIERCIGAARIPLGLVGPLAVRGLAAFGHYHVPLATSEAALIASYQRGARALARSGGATSVLLAESVARTPGFVFDRLETAARFIEWVNGAFDAIKACADATTRYGALQDLRYTVEGNHVYVAFEYTTRDAAGQNMTTIATDAACRWIAANTPVPIVRWYLEANGSGDKKASAQSYCLVRGRKVCADAVIPADVLRDELSTTAEAMADYWRMAAMGGVLSGTVGVQGHFANGLAGLFLATGQDVACVAESAVGVTRLEARDDGALYATVSLPNVILGSVGGGTMLPTAAACLRLLGAHGADGAAVLAEITGALLLAGELSLMAALTSDSFGRAHRVLRRRHRASDDAGA